MKITIVKKAQVQKNASDRATCPFIIEDMLNGKK